jgi:hypothetical protein
VEVNFVRNRAAAEECLAAIRSEVGTAGSSLRHRRARRRGRAVAELASEKGRLDILINASVAIDRLCSGTRRTTGSGSCE